MTRKSVLVAAYMLALAAAPAGAQFASGGFTFLQAVQQRDGTTATSMLESSGASLVNFRNDEGTGAMHIVTQRRDTQWLRFLMSKGADVNLANGAGDTPLHLASRSGWIEGMDILLDAGARVDRPNRLGETALIMAVQQKQVAAVRRLLEAGANPDRTDNASGRSARDYARLDTRSTELIRLIEQTRSKKPAAAAGPKL